MVCHSQQYLRCYPIFEWGKQKLHFWFVCYYTCFSFDVIKIYFYIRFMSKVPHTCRSLKNCLINKIDLRFKILLLCAFEYWVRFVESKRKKKHYSTCSVQSWIFQGWWSNLANSIWSSNLLDFFPFQLVMRFYFEESFVCVYHYY